MKKTKKMCLIAGIIGLAAVAGVAINSANSAPKMSDLMLKNLEILTRYENGGSEGFQIQSTEGRCYVYVNGKEYQG